MFHHGTSDAGVYIMQVNHIIPPTLSQKNQFYTHKEGNYWGFLFPVTLFFSLFPYVVISGS